MSIEVAIVTGASQNHYKSLKQFLSTVNKSIYRCYVYDLGLDEKSVNELKSISGVIVKYFDYSKYPTYYNIHIKAGEYAWKPAIIHELTVELVREGVIQYLIWCDSGDKILNPSLNTLLPFLTMNKIYSPESSGDIRKWTHPLCLNWFSISNTDPILSRKNRNGAILTFKISDVYIQEFIADFARCASIKGCISPEGSSRMNHRQDQAVFTILYYKFLEKHPELLIEDRYLDISIHNDID